jgi:hypothetical protein
MVHTDMVATLGEATPSYSIEKNWAADFKCWREEVDVGAANFTMPDVIHG